MSIQKLRKTLSQDMSLDRWDKLGTGMRILADRNKKPHPFHSKQELRLFMLANNMDILLV